MLFTSEEERQLARGVFAGPVYKETVVAYGTAEPPPPSQVQRDAFRALLPGLGNRSYLLFLSRIHEKKGCDLLVSAFANIAQHYPDVDLVIAGPDQVGLKARLQEQAKAAGIADRIHWPGMLKGDAKWGAFHDAEAFILPSHSENFGIVVAEAMACQTPVLISNKINIWREVEASGGGFVEDDTLDGTSRLLERWLALGPSEKAAMAGSAKEGFERNFHVAAAGRDLENALLIAANGGSK